MEKSEALKQKIERFKKRRKEKTEPQLLKHAAKMLIAGTPRETVMYGLRNIPDFESKFDSAYPDLNEDFLDQIAYIDSMFGEKSIPFARKKEWETAKSRVDIQWLNKWFVAIEAIEQYPEE